MRNANVKWPIFIAALVLAVDTAFAQPGGGGPGDPLPISGLEWLLLAGGMLGVRKVYQNYRSRRNE